MNGPEAVILAAGPVRVWFPIRPRLFIAWVAAAGLGRASQLRATETALVVIGPGLPARDLVPPDVRFVEQRERAPVTPFNKLRSCAAGATWCQVTADMPLVRPRVCGR
jgi:hypothetical protein